MRCSKCNVLAMFIHTVTVAMKFTSPAFICALAQEPEHCLDDNFILKSIVEGYLPAGITSLCVS